MGKSAPGYALRGFPHAILYRLLTLQRKNGGVHNPHCATLQTSRLHDERLKPLGKFQRASLGTFKRAPTLLTEKTQRSIDLLKERRAAFITAAVTGQIDLRESA